MPNSNIIIVLVLGGATLAASHLRAESASARYDAYPQSSQAQQPNRDREQLAPESSNLKASNLIGMSVRNDAGDRLGKVQDLVINLGSDAVPFAIIEYGGALGVAATRVAVPLDDLRWSPQNRELRLAATRAQFDAATSRPTGRWLSVAGEDWAKDVDRFYGQPRLAGQARFERQESEVEGAREPVRTPAGQTGSSMQYPNTGLSGQSVDTMTRPADDQLAAQINALVQQNVQNGARNIQVVIRNGVVTLRGRIPTQEQKELLEKQIKALPGVDRVQDSAITGTE